MPKFLIETADIPTGTLELQTPISAGRGWLDLVNQAVMIAAGEPILSIKEKDGLLTVQLLTKDAGKLEQMDALREASASICEICGERGTLAGHYQIRCEDHQGWRTTRPFPPDQRGYIEAYEWKNADAVSLEFGSVESDLLTREQVRRKALCALRSKEKRAQAIRDLLRVRRADIEYPIGPAAHLSVDEIAAIVPIHMHEGRLPIVRDRDIPEPWGARFAIASVGSTRIAPGAYEHDWRNFLEIWPRDNAEIDELFEAELERAISAGFSQGLARGAAKRAELGVDDDELYAWVQERCRIGFWPDDDLLEEFRAWSAKIKAHPPILIIDLENTCMHDQERPAGYHHQIIEIGAAWVTETGEVLEKFSTLVQAENPVTEFCTELLGITQADVDRGLPFCEAMQALAGFAALYPSTTWASWGAADLNSLNCDCTHHGLESPLQGWVHRNLKKEWAKARKIKMVGMAKALEIAGITLEGAHHRALDDALNLAKLFAGQENTPNADSSESSMSWASQQNLPKADPDFLQEHEEIIDVNPGSRSP